MPLRQRELQTIPSRSRLIKGLAFFLLSIFLVSFNYLSAAPAFLLCVLGFARIRIIDNDFYYILYQNVFSFFMKSNKRFPTSIKKYIKY